MAVIKRAVTDEDRKKNRYFEHMAGLVGTVQNVYSDTELSLRVDPESMTPITAEVHRIANQRMRERLKEIPEEHRKMLTEEELEFTANYVVMVQASDLVAA